MKAVITTDSISLLPLRGRHLPFTRPRAATLSVVIAAYTIIWGNFADIHNNNLFNGCPGTWQKHEKTYHNPNFTSCRTAHSPRRPVGGRILRVFQGVGGDAHFFLAFQINLRRVEAVTLLGLRVVRFRYTECFRPFVVLRRGVAMVVLDSLCVLFHL